MDPVKPIIAIKPKDPTRLWISWHLGNVCNFSCDYCPSYLHAGDHRWPELEPSKRFLRAVYEEYRGRRKKRYIAYSFTGGEPTMCPHLIDMIKYIRSIDKYAYIHLVSNGSRTMRYWQELAPYLSKAIVTYHHREADLEHTLAVTTFLHQQNRLEKIHCNMDPADWDKCYIASRRFKEAGLPTMLKPLIKNFTDEIYDYLPEQLAVIRQESTSSLMVWVDRGEGLEQSTVQNVIANKENRFQGWQCNAGLEVLVVKRDGRVVTAECGMSQLMNLNHLPEQIVFPTEGHLCPLATCGCIVDIAITKHKLSS